MIETNEQRAREHTMNTILDFAERRSWKFWAVAAILWVVAAAMSASKGNTLGAASAATIVLLSAFMSGTNLMMEIAEEKIEDGDWEVKA